MSEHGFQIDENRSTRKAKSSMLQAVVPRGMIGLVVWLWDGDGINSLTKAGGGRQVLSCAAPRDRSSCETQVWIDNDAAEVRPP
jgi:hypothetical protein